MAGYAGGFAGPLAIGCILDRAGGMATTGWGLAFLHVTLVGLVGQAAFVALRPRCRRGQEPRRHRGRGRRALTFGPWGWK